MVKLVTVGLVPAGEAWKMCPLSASAEYVPALKTTRIFELVAMGTLAGPGGALLIRGEPGVGKDTLARLIHADSGRRAHSFIKVNCAGQSVDRLEAELFGHEKWASPLGVRRRLGSFEFANHGTIYLDEIGALPRALVPRLIHVVQTGELSRTGGSEIRRVDVHVIASTVQSVKAEGDDDLWHALRRLDLVDLWLPPLRERTEEIPAFASFFLERFKYRYGQDIQLCSDVLTTFRTRPWPGNVRELEEAVRRLVADGPRSSAH